MRVQATALLWMVAAAGLVGCGAANEPRPVKPGRPDPAVGTWQSADDGRLAPRAVRRIGPPESIRIGDPAPSPAPTRPRRHAAVNVSFHEADLENALQLLADAGRFNLVIESGLTGSISATLRGVDAYDALVAIAETNGGEVQYERNIVVVRKRTR